MLLLSFQHQNLHGASRKERRSGKSNRAQSFSGSKGLDRPPGSEEGQVCFSVSMGWRVDVTAEEGGRLGQVRGVKFHLQQLWMKS